MHTIFLDRRKLPALVATIALVIAVGLLVAASIAGAQQDPQKEPFAGQLMRAPDGQTLASADPVAIEDLGPDWWPIFSEDFESANWLDDWDVDLDLSNPPVGLKWGAQTIANSLDISSVKSAWAICADLDCSNVDPIAPSFPKGVNSWLVAGPFDLSKAKDAQLNFDLFYEANSGDPVTVSVSQDRLVFTEQFTEDSNVNNGSWEAKTVSLSDFAGDPGSPQLWIAFTFQSDAAAQKLGAMIDNVSLWVQGAPPSYLPYVVKDFVPTATAAPPTPTPSPTPQPAGGNYEKNFTNNIDGWEARRWTNGTAYDLGQDPADDGGRQGFLNLKVNTSNSHYVIVSPLVAARTAPYNIETVVKLRSPRSTGDQYGVIFGANYNGGTCPVTDFSTCFTQYYEMRVRFYHDDAADKDRMEMKLKKVTGHDSDNNNSGPDLIDWTRVSSVEEDDFIEWDITVEANGSIKISANDLPVASGKDTAYLNNPYFGFIVRTQDKPDAEAKFDYIKIDWQD